jgi:L-seryl-tRNA(Ser) seleniumtransferase
MAVIIGELVRCSTRRRYHQELPTELAVKIEPRLPQLPSLAELLEHPRVRGLVERVNRSTIAQRASGFLDEVRHSLAERAGRIEVPSVAHLAERLARRLLGAPTATGQVINATGLVYGDPRWAAPLPELALHAMVQIGGEFHSCDSTSRCRVEQQLAALAGAEAAHLTNSFESAVTLAAAATAGQREVQIFGDGEATSPINWRWLAARAGCAISFRSATGQEVAQSALDESRLAAVVRTPDGETIDLAALHAARTRGGCLIDVAPLAGVANPSVVGCESIPTIAERLAAGADLVVVDGAGLLGGPSTGVVLGSRQVVDALAEHPLDALLAQEPVTFAAWDAVLPLHREGHGPEANFQIPVWQLLSAPLANLEQRARRLAALMAEATGIATAEAREVDSPWRRWGRREWLARTWRIEVRTSDGRPESLVAHLGRGPQSIVVGVLDGAVHFDLRTVFPRWDQQLVAAVESWRGTPVDVEPTPH